MSATPEDLVEILKGLASTDPKTADDLALDMIAAGLNFIRLQKSARACAEICDQLAQDFIDEVARPQESEGSAMTLRSIDASGYAPPSNLRAGPAPVLEWLKIAHLVVDDGYQRRISKAGRSAIRAIADAFDWSQFSPVVVAPVEGGRYAIIDGQHRTTAAAVCGFDTVPCEIVMVDRQRQAAAFSAINGRVQRITTMQIFHAAREAEEPWALRVAAVTDSAGVTVLRYAIGASVPDRPKHSTMAVVVIRKLIEKYGADVVTLALRCITGSQLGDDPGALGQLWIGAISVVLFERPELLARQDGVIAFFDNIDSGALLKAAHQGRGHGVSATESLAIRLRAEIDAEHALEAA